MNYRAVPCVVGSVGRQRTLYACPRFISLLIIYRSCQNVESKFDIGLWLLICMYVCVQARATCKRASASEQTYILIDTKTEKLMNRHRI